MADVIALPTAAPHPVVQVRRRSSKDTRLGVTPIHTAGTRLKYRDGARTSLTVSDKRQTDSTLKRNDYLLQREPGWKARLYLETMVENGTATPDELVTAALIISARHRLGLLQEEVSHE